MADLGPDLVTGFTNHMPMAVEALCAIGEGAAAEAWLGPRLSDALPRPAPARPVDAVAWRTVLGTPGSFASWHAFFSAAL